MVRFSLSSRSSDDHGIGATDVLAFVFFVLTASFALILIAFFGWTASTPYIIAIAFFFLGIVVLNRLGYGSLGRLLFALVPSWAALAISIIAKLAEEQSYISYFDSRIILLALGILPAIIFDLREKNKLFVSMTSNFMTLVLFDPLHEWFQVGFFQQGFVLPSYYYINYIAVIAFAGINGAMLVLKAQFTRANDAAQAALADNKNINQQLQDRNRDLQNSTHELEAQNEEILQQQEEMTTNQEMLEQANRVIMEQKAKLEEYNNRLEKMVEEKSGELRRTNEELIKSNNELKQFSFTVSHNLRGPVARLLGLTELINSDVAPNESRKIASYIHQSATELDGILKDLTTIIDVRNELYRVKEKISIEEVVEKAKELLGPSALANCPIELSLDVPVVFGIKPMVQSLFFNLLSNALKYRSPDRPLRIEVRSFFAEGKTMVQVIDNGLGLDLALHGENLFRLYRRFHLHVPGKGLGLYLVRSQMEIMGGRVEVESEVGSGSCFSLIFANPPNMDRQIFFENESAQLYYDANINNTVIIWKRHVTSKEYRDVFQTVLHTIKRYNTPGWIADLRNQGVIAPEDQQWFVSNVLTAAADNGLVRIATVGFTDPIRKSYYEKMIAVTREYGIDLRVFPGLEQAVDWMGQQRPN